MTREEIKKGLECCKTDWCVRCPYFEYVGCEVGLKQDAHNLITKQEQEIAELKAAKNDWKQRYESLDQRYMALVASSVECVDKKVKKAKLDVLNELRTYCFEREDYHGARQQQIEQLLRLDEKKKMRPSFGENEKRELKNSADKANGQSTMANKVVEKIDDLLKEVEND